jgi:hypothetical protein
VVISEAGGSGYEPKILLACQSTDWWLDTRANIHVCSDLNLLSTYQVANGCSVLMDNGSRAVAQGVGSVDLKLTFGKTLSLKNVQHVLGINRNLISGSLLCRDDFKLVFKSNKFIVSKFGLFTSTGYICRGLFCLSVIEDCNKFVNLSSCLNSEYSDGEATVWHSWLCHINFDRIIRLSKLNLIPEIPVVRRSKCHACVQAKQPRKPFKSMEEKSLAPLELIHSNLCEMNRILTRGGGDISYVLLMTLLDGVNSILLKQKMRL